jgi:hypothetical protein
VDGNALSHTPPRSWPRPKPPFIVGGILVIVALVIGLLVLRPSSPSKSEPPEPTVWEAIVDQVHGDGQMTKAGALEAFAYAYQVDIPGVLLTSGR